MSWLRIIEVNVTASESEINQGMEPSTQKSSPEFLWKLGESVHAGGLGLLLPCVWTPDKRPPMF